MPQSPGAKFTADGFDDIGKALDAIIEKANKATEAITKMFDIDGSKMGTMNTLKGIHNILKNINKSMNRASSSQNAPRSSSSAREKPGRIPWLSRQIDKFQIMGFERFKTTMAMKTLFGGPTGAMRSALGRDGGFGISRYGPGPAGILAKYRMFRKPFPGSDRNVFSLGDVAAAGQNVAYGAGTGIEGAFKAITGSAMAVTRTLSGLGVTVATLVNPALGALVGGISDIFIGMLEKLNAVVAGVIGSLTKLATSLLGFASRAVEAASDLTEAVNAANVIAGPKASASMLAYATSLQKEYGLSVTDGMKAMGRMAGMMRNLGGFGQEESGLAAKELYRYAVDIGSVMNKSAEEVGMAMMSGLAGRLTPLRRFGIGMTAPQLDQMAKSQGMVRPGMRVDYEARIRQFVEEFARQGGLFIGDLERTRYEFANQRRKLMGQFEALFVSVGRALEPFAKVVLFVANDIMSSVLDVLAPFGKAKNNMVELSGFDLAAPYIKQFIYYALYAKNALTEFAKKVYESRAQIAEWAAKIGRGFTEMMLALLRYSTNVLNMFASFLSAMSELIPIVEFLGNTFMWLADFLTKRFGLESGWRAERTTRIDAIDREIAAVARGKGPSAMGGGNVLGVRDRINLLQHEKSRLQGELADSPFKKILLGTGTFAKNIPVKLEEFTKSIGAAFGELGINAPTSAEVSKAWSMLAPAISQGNPVAPAPDMSTGRLVQYFDPARFRDAVQERDLGGATIETAKNTAEMVTLLQTIADKALNPGGVLMPQPVSAFIAQ